MPFTNTGKSNLLTATGITHVTAFDGDPTGAGTELATAREAITISDDGDGTAQQSEASIDIAVGAGTVDHIGYYDAASGGNLLAYDPVTAEVFAAPGTYRLTETDLSV